MSVFHALATIFLPSLERHPRTSIEESRDLLRCPNPLARIEATDGSGFDLERGRLVK
jgi:hypothetical protein